MAGDSGQVRFDRPPVRTVVLTVYFSAIGSLQVSHLSGLRQLWRDAYPNVAELPPLRPLRRDGNEGELVPVDGAWPFPYVMYTSDDDQQMIAVQGDRFVRSWSFDDDGEPYPGFDALYKDLCEKFDQFNTVVAEETDQTIDVSASECLYINEFEDSDPQKLLVGVATRWGVTGPPSGFPSARYAGLRFHLDDPAHEGLRAEVLLDLESDEVPTLGFSTRLHQRDSSGPQGMDGMLVAHKKALDLFLEFTSTDMHDDWGNRS